MNETNERHVSNEGRKSKIKSNDKQLFFLSETRNLFYTVILLHKHCTEQKDFQHLKKKDDKSYIWRQHNIATS